MHLHFEKGSKCLKCFTKHHQPAAVSATTAATQKKKIIKKKLYTFFFNLIKNYTPASVSAPTTATPRERFCGGCQSQPEAGCRQGCNLPRHLRNHSWLTRTNLIINTFLTTYFIKLWSNIWLRIKNIRHHHNHSWLTRTNLTINT